MIILEDNLYAAGAYFDSFRLDLLDWLVDIATRHTVFLHDAAWRRSVH